MTRWMDIAWANSGIVETPGAAATPEIVAFFARVGKPEVTSDEVPWCAAFAGSCLKAGGVDISGIPKSQRLMARAYLGVGQPIDQVRVGAICVVTRPNAGPEAGHVGFVTGWTDSHVMLLGGNQANSVTVAPFKRADILGLRWPGAAKTPGELAADGSRIAAAAERQQKDAVKSGGVTTTAPMAPATPPPKLGLTEVAAKAEGFRGALETLHSFATFAAGKWPWIAGALAVYWVGRMLYDSQIIKLARADDHATGKTLSVAPGDSPAGSRPPGAFAASARDGEIFDAVAS